MRISRFVTLCLLAIVTCAVLTSCGNDDLSDDDLSNDGTAPESLEGTELVLYNSSGKPIGIKHLSPHVYLDTDVMVDYSDRYAPTYQYYADDNIGKYLLIATTKTYISYYKTYSYAQFMFDIQLLFNSGTYSGTQYNADGSSKHVSGTFTLKSL